MAATKTKPSDDLEQTTWPDSDPPGDSVAANSSPYAVASQTAAEEGRPHQPIDQRTGRVVGSTVDTPAQRQAELRAIDEARERELDGFIEGIRAGIGEPAAYGATSDAVDVRKANELLRAALERLAAQPDDRGVLAARALQRLDKQSGLVKAGVGLKW